MTPQELKESIILSAMQGKLVVQIDSEEPSAALLDRISSEQAIQIKAKKVKASKADAITEEDIPFDIPSTWSWVRFGNLVCYNMGKTPPRAESQWWGAGVPWVSIADMPESGHILETKESVTHEAINDKFSGRISKAGTLIMSFKLTVGRVSILDIDAVHNEAIISIYPYADENETIKKYLFAILPYVAQSGNSKNAIKGKTLNDTSISNLLIPLPPIAEQKRIAAKLEEILPLIERYEVAWSKLEEFNKRFPGDMQKSILQLALQGKLVEQRPEEGAGEELFQQIQVEKQALIAAGKIKKEKPLPEITEEEIPFDIPATWKWTRIGELFTVVRGSSPRPKGSPLYWSPIPTQHHWVTIKDITAFSQNGMLCQTYEYLTDEGSTKSTFVPAGELIIAVSGSTTGKFCILGIDGYIYDGLAAILNPTKIIGNKYLRYFFMWIYERLNAQKVGSAFPNINTDMLKNTLIPIPPLEEQKRIVAKLEEILPLCDRLK